MQVNGITVRLIKGDVTLSETEAFVFYADGNLKLGTGFGNAIAMRAGPSVQEELNSLAPLAPLQAVVSSAGDLPAEYIVHVNGPKFQEPDLETKLYTAMLNALQAAAEKQIKSLAFPPMGTGFYGVPLAVSARIMQKAITEFSLHESSLEEIQIVLMNTREYQPFAEVFETTEQEAVA